jgi:hypothetical protein
MFTHIKDLKAKKIAFYLIFLIPLILFFSAADIHSDFRSHHDCALCNLLNLFINSILACAFYLVIIIIRENFSDIFSINSLKYFYFKFSKRAPPLFS